MPIYEYVCQHCGHHLEAFQKISEDPLVNCPECGQASLTKMVSATGFRLKGSGWYETDFKQGDKKKNLVQSTSETTEGSSSSDSSGSSGSEGASGSSDASSASGDSSSSSNSSNSSTSTPSSSSNVS